jgi:hypothetical protein
MEVWGELKISIDSSAAFRFFCRLEAFLALSPVIRSEWRLQSLSLNCETFFSESTRIILALMFGNGWL